MNKKILAGGVAAALYQSAIIAAEILGKDPPPARYDAKSAKHALGRRRNFKENCRAFQINVYDRRHAVEDFENALFFGGFEVEIPLMENYSQAVFSITVAI